MPSISQAPPLPIVYICLPLVFILATWLQKAFKFASRLKIIVFSSFLKPGSKCQNYHGWCGEYWLLSFFPPLFLFPHSTLLHRSSRIPTSAAPFGEKYLLIALKRASLEYHPNSFSWFTNPCMIWLSLHIRLTFLSVPQYTKFISSTWNAFLSDL